MWRLTTVGCQQPIRKQEGVCGTELMKTKQTIHCQGHAVPRVYRNYTRTLYTKHNLEQFNVALIVITCFCQVLLRDHTEEDKTYFIYTLFIQLPQNGLTWHWKPRPLLDLLLNQFYHQQVGSVMQTYIQPWVSLVSQNVGTIEHLIIRQHAWKEGKSGWEPNIRHIKIIKIHKMLQFTFCTSLIKSYWLLIRTAIPKFITPRTPFNILTSWRTPPKNKQKSQFTVIMHYV